MTPSLTLISLRCLKRHPHTLFSHSRKTFQTPIIMAPHRSFQNFQAKPKEIASNRTKAYQDRRGPLRKIAEQTLAAIDDGYDSNGVRYTLKDKVAASKRATAYYAPGSELSAWATEIPSQPDASASTTTPPAVVTPTQISILEISTLDATRYLASDTSTSGKIGILNFASAKKPGGGFLTGAQAQEESIARSSTLYPTLMTKTAQQFYKLHEKDSKDGYYSHAMIYSPNVLIIRDDDGGWTEPVEVDVVTSPAVNAGVVRRSLMGKLSPQGSEERIEKVMKERMGRILFLMESAGMKRIVLGSYGTGVFKNNVEAVARIWAELLAVPGSRFEKSFEAVVFGVLGRQTFVDFEKSFKARCNAG